MVRLGNSFLRYSLVFTCSLGFNVESLHAIIVENPKQVEEIPMDGDSPLTHSDLLSPLYRSSRP